MKLSPKAQKWVDERTKSIQLKAKLYEAGGHIMLKEEAYRVDLLPEPLRLEVEAYDKCRSAQRLKDNRENLEIRTESLNREQAIKAKGKLLDDDETTWWFRRSEKGNNTFS